MPENKILSEEVNDIVEQEVPVEQKVFEQEHTNTHSQEHHEHKEHAHKSITHEHHAHKETKHHKFWDTTPTHHEKKGFKQMLWDNRQIIILLVVIFLLAFGIRAHLMQYHYLFEFDAFYHARLVEQLVTQGQIITPDPMVYYQVAGGVAAQPWSIFHGISQAFYYLVSMGQPYSKDTLMWSMQVSPVIFGSLICILMYFLGKEVFNNRKIGIITAFVAAVTPAFAYRTMAGAQGDNSFGFLWFVIGFIFFVRAVKVNNLDKNTIINIVLSGFFFGLMSMTWRMYLLIPLIIIAYFLFAVVLVATKQENHPQKLKDNHAFALTVKVLISMIIFHLMSYAYGEDWISDALGKVSSVIHTSPMTVLILAVVAGIILFALSVFYITKASKETKKIFGILVILGLYVSIIAMLFLFITVPDLSDRSKISSMVGEEAVGNNFFGTKYNELIIFPWLGIILFPIMLWVFKKDDLHTGIIFFFWVLITLFMAWYTLKFTFVFGLAIAPAAALVSYMFIEGLKRFNIEKGIEAKVILAVLFILLLLGVGASARFFNDYAPYTDEHPEWQHAISWIKTNTPTDAKFFNWWDQGHILAFNTDRKFSTDNRNESNSANMALAKFVIATDSNEGYTIASKEIGADYIILDSAMFSEASTFEYYVADKIDSKLAQKYYTGVTRILNCTAPDVNATVVYCEGNQIPIEQWNMLATTWKATPDDFQNGTEPIFYYRTNDQVIVLNQALNKTNIAKAWLNSAETSAYYEIAYNKGGILILKIKK